MLTVNASLSSNVSTARWSPPSPSKAASSTFTSNNSDIVPNHQLSPSVKKQEAYLSLRRPIVLRTTYGITAEPNRQKYRAGIAMVMWPHYPRLFQTRKFQRFGFRPNDTFYCKSVWRRRYNFQPLSTSCNFNSMALHSLYCADVPLRNCSLTHPSPTMSATMQRHSDGRTDGRTDRQTDRRQYDVNSRSYCASGTIA